MHSFAIGDKVQLMYEPSSYDENAKTIRETTTAGFYNECLHAGDTGTVVDLEIVGRIEGKPTPWCRVRWNVEPSLSLHTCGGRAPNGTGWNVPEAMLVKCDDMVKLDLDGFDPFAIL